jgi:hypothetical protein
MKDHPDIAIQASPAIKPAVDELYSWLVTTYLPTRFPKMYTLYGSGLLNHATAQILPSQPALDPIKTFELLGENLEDDFLILLPSEDGDGYKLQGYVTCFPAGFNTKEKFGLKLRDIHKPVPGYKEKLELSMDRTFDRLEVGKVVKRSNASPQCPQEKTMLINMKWSISTHERLYAASGGNHLYAGEEVVEEEIDINNVRSICVTWTR